MISQNADVAYIQALEAKAQKPIEEPISREELKALQIQVRMMLPRLNLLKQAANSQPNF
jgi:hypothetical protein